VLIKPLLSTVSTVCDNSAQVLSTIAKLVKREKRRVKKEEEKLSMLSKKHVFIQTKKRTKKDKPKS